MSTEVMPDFFESWADPHFAPKLAARLESRLVPRMKGRQWVMITLTYDPSQYKNAAECYNESVRHKHVSNFIRDLAHQIALHNGHVARRGERLNAGLFAGRWFCKMEFTERGWPHYHLLFDYRFMPKQCVDAAWGRGMCKTEGVASVGGSAKYVAKYNSKSMSWPSWALEMRPRSVRIVRTSRGFWDGPEAASHDNSDDDDECRCGECYRCISARSDEQRLSPRKWRVFAGFTAAELAQLQAEFDSIDDRLARSRAAMSFAFVPYSARLASRGVRILHRRQDGSVSACRRLALDPASVFACLGAAAQCRPGIARKSLSCDLSYASCLAWLPASSERVRSGVSTCFQEANCAVSRTTAYNWATVQLLGSGEGAPAATAAGAPLGLSDYESWRHPSHAKPLCDRERAFALLQSLGEFEEGWSLYDS